MSNIGKKTIENAADMLKSTLEIYREKIDRAYLKAGDSALSVSLKLKFKDSDTQIGAIDVSCDIDFVTDRIKNLFKRTVNENAEELFPAKNNVVHIKAPIIQPEDWYSGLDWLVGWGKDRDRYERVSVPLHVNQAYALLNEMRDAWEDMIENRAERIEVGYADFWHDYRVEFYGEVEQAQAVGE
jgi:hypothetical protein